MTQHPQRRRGTNNQPDRRAEVGKEVRVWLLALICAGPGGAAVYLTDSLLVGVWVFLACLIVFGGILFFYERSRTK